MCPQLSPPLLPLLLQAAYMSQSQPNADVSQHLPWSLVPAAGPEVHFPPIPSFSPELFAYMRCAPNQKKAFNKGVEALTGEGAVQVTSAMRSTVLFGQ